MMYKSEGMNPVSPFGAPSQLYALAGILKFNFHTRKFAHEIKNARGELSDHLNILLFDVWGVPMYDHPSQTRASLNNHPNPLCIENVN